VVPKKTGTEKRTGTAFMEPKTGPEPALKISWNQNQNRDRGKNHLGTKTGIVFLQDYYHNLLFD
jgi:hypothetical protein